MVMTSKNDEQAFEELLTYLQQSRSLDLKEYKRTSLMRRVRKQMSLNAIEQFSDYLDYLQVNADELIHLINSVFINVTSFCRDPNAWEYFNETLVPTLITPKGNQELIRIWSAGCASGQEAYTIAMLLADALGIKEFHRRVKIYATDIDSVALSQARQATYHVKELNEVPKGWLEQYFDHRDNVFIVHPKIRQQVIFGRHNLLQDAPISHLDLLLCRNTLMYFNSEAQTKVVNRFHFALNENGFLFLGKAEILLNHTDLFTATNLRHRIFRRVSTLNRRERTVGKKAGVDAQTLKGNEDYISLTKLRYLAFGASASPQILIDNRGYLVSANTQARDLFGLTDEDEGRLLQDLKVSYRPLELRSLIESVSADRTPTVISNVPWTQLNQEIQYFDVRLIPLEEDDIVLGTSITFRNVTQYHLLRQELQRTNQELERANEELHSSNEELETTNEELQSTNEELEHTNEELQLTNEELETTNSKLQLTNEELIRATRKKDEFLANVSHELRTPLNAILGLTESLQAGVYGGLPVHQTKPLEIIYRSGTHLLALISDILDLTKIEAGQVALDLSFVPILGLCQSALDLIQHQAKQKNLHIQTRMPSDLPDLLLDERRIRQILVNLLINAVKFTPEEGAITLEVHLTTEDVEDSPDTLDNIVQSRINISIIDTGIGIAPEHLNQLFQPFSQIDSKLSRNYDGLGLGLYLVKQIAALHGGDVNVSSSLGTGSCFTLSIPCVTRPRTFPPTRE